MLCVEISKEKSTIPVAEIASFCKIKKVYRDVVICEGETPKLKRLAYSRSVNDLLFTCSPDELQEKTYGMHYDDFCVRVFNAGKEKESMERAIGAVIDGRVNLKSARNEIRIFLEGNEALVCRNIFIIKERFDERRATKRPFFSPTSLHPRLARAMINLSGAKKEILDPFCGTGGILIEGALMGLKVYGSDIQERMIEGCKENLRFFGFGAKDNDCNHALSCSDIGESGFKNVEAIVTDMPYGRSSYTAKEQLCSLYQRSFEKFHAILRPGGKAVVCTNNQSFLMLYAEHFKLHSLHKVYVNRSMCRYIGVFIRI